MRYIFVILLIQFLVLGAYVYSQLLAIGPSGNSLEKDIKLFKNYTESNNISLKGHSLAINSIETLAHNIFASGSDDGTIRVWDLINGTLIKILYNHTSPVRSIIQINDSMFASASSDSTIIIWNLTDYTPIKILKKTHEDKLYCLNHIKLESILITGYDDGHVKMWSLNKNLELIFKLNYPGTKIKSIAVFERSIAIGLENGDIYSYTYDKLKQNQKPNLKCTNGIFTLKFLNQNQLACGSLSDLVHVFGLSSSYKSFTLYNHTSGVLSLDVLGNDILISGSYDFSINIWKIEKSKGQLLKKIKLSQIPESIKLLKLITYTVVPLPGLFDWTLDELCAILKNDEYDVTDCLSSCNNRGLCKLLKKKKYTCFCEPGYSGASCEINLNPCASGPCLNNANCTNGNNSYTCHCEGLYYGANCESRINICHNVTCSKHGTCEDIDDVPVCKCFGLFYGDNCEFETVQKKVTQNLVKTASVLAILILVLIYSIFLICDISSYFNVGKRKISNSRRYNHQHRRKRNTY